MLQPALSTVIEPPRVQFTEFVSCNGLVPDTSQQKGTEINLHRNSMNSYPGETVLKQMAQHLIHIGCVPVIQVLLPKL
jgi:hypothetical protein